MTTIRIAAAAGLTGLFWLRLTWPPKIPGYQQGHVMRGSRWVAGLVVVAVLTVVAAGCGSAATRNTTGVISPTTTSVCSDSRPSAPPKDLQPSEYIPAPTGPPEGGGCR